MDRELLDLTIDALGGVITRLENEDRDKPLDQEYIRNELQDAVTDMGELLEAGSRAMGAWDVYMMTWDDQANAREPEHKQEFIRAARRLRNELVLVRNQLELQQA